jgi:hypothetical protein
MARVLESSWGRLFRAWETLEPDAKGFPQPGAEPAQIERTGLRAFFTSLGILWTCLKEAPDLMFRRKKTPSAVGS